MGQDFSYSYCTNADTEVGALIFTLGAERGQSAWAQGRQGAGASIFPETGSKAVS